MLYWWFEGMNPLFVVFALCPILAVILGIRWYASKWCSRTIALGVSLLLPLLYIASDWGTFTANLDAWLLYGIGYSLVNWATYRLLRAVMGYKS